MEEAEERYSSKDNHLTENLSEKARYRPVNITVFAKLGHEDLKFETSLGSEVNSKLVGDTEWKPASTVSRSEGTLMQRVLWPSRWHTWEAEGRSLPKTAKKTNQPNVLEKVSYLALGFTIFNRTNYTYCIPSENATLWCGEHVPSGHEC